MLIFARNKLNEKLLIIDSTYIFIEIEKYADLRLDYIVFSVLVL